MHVPSHAASAFVWAICQRKPGPRDLLGYTKIVPSMKLVYGQAGAKGLLVAGLSQTIAAFALCQEVASRQQAALPRHLPSSKHSGSRHEPSVFQAGHSNIDGHRQFGRQGPANRLPSSHDHLCRQVNIWWKAGMNSPAQGLHEPGQ